MAVGVFEMSCFDPLRAYQRAKGERVQFYERGDVRALDVRCSTCIGCRLDRAGSWAVRCVNESKLYDENCFLTLTYDEKHVPKDGSLRYSDVQAFLRRLRKARDGKDPKYGIRFFCAGEYGETTLRPHYHMLLFNYDFDDRVRFGESRSCSSDELEFFWKLGHARRDDVSPESVAYVTRYALKKVYGRVAGDAHYSRIDPVTGEIVTRVPEFIQMSLKPGIGAEWFERYESDFRQGDYVVVKGRKVPMPQYYRRKLPAEIAEKFDEQRELFMSEQDPGERSDARLAVRDEVARGRLRHYELEQRGF